MPQSLTSLEVGLPTLHHWAPGICPEPASHRTSAPSSRSPQLGRLGVPRTLPAQRRHWGRGAGQGRGVGAWGGGGPGSTGICFAASFPDPSI